MRFLLDTQLLLWAKSEPATLSTEALALLNEVSASELCFSAANLWEIAIKFGRGKPDFVVDPVPFRNGLLRDGHTELPISSEHAMLVAGLPPIHKDPFDRLLLAQATREGMTLVTSDRTIARYPGRILFV